MTKEEADNTMVSESIFDMAANVPRLVAPYNPRRIALFMVSGTGSSRFATQGAGLPGASNVALPGFTQIGGASNIGVNENDYGALARSQWFAYSQFADTITVIEVLRK